MSDTHVDRKVLSDLQDVMEDGYINLLETFLADSEVRMRQLYQARHAEELGQAAHSFKGSASNMGAHQLAELCRQLEERVSQHSLFGIEHLINQIHREFGEVRQVFRDERKRVQVS
ncbi:MAG TPA: histidine kinase [Pseudomonas sp.]|nr:histidine kinase [Pseudomonas sp.]